MNDTAERVKKIIVEYLGGQPENVPDEAAFDEDLEVDSLAMMELIVAFEEEFAIEIGDASLDKIVTVGDAIDAINSLRSSTSAS